ncbi:phospholipase [Rhodobacteraceae bacterium MCCB 386]|nr:phospholipase [Roseitranquillus sediminis]
MPVLRGGILHPGDTCWRLARADRLGVIVDAADYFAAARAAMLDAEESILLIGWDFDLRIDLVPGETDDGAPQELGPFLKHLVRRKPHLGIRILKWDMAVVYMMKSQFLPLMALDLRSVDRIRLRFDSKHPWGAAHHQKIVVIDDALAFCGGIDMTTNRWDTRDHLPADERRRRPDGELSGPWHDATTAVDGDAARALGDLARARWHVATGQRLRPPRWRRPIWPKSIAPQMQDVEVGIARTMPAYEDRPAINEIERLYRAAIRAARKTIYLESQYFASASICEAIEERLAEPDGPEILVINPESMIGWLEEHTMEVARELRLASIQRADCYGRFAICHPVNEAGRPIYVHAKVLIVDDRLIRVGSSNVNNRSMGFDTECDLAVDATDDATRAAILAIRDDLLGEHLDVEPAEVRRVVEECGSLIGAVRRLQRAEGRTLRPVRRIEVNEAEKAVARAHLADPELPGGPEGRIAHMAKRLALSVPLSAWLGLAALGVAGAIYEVRRRR